MWRCDGLRGWGRELWSRLNLPPATSRDGLCQGLHPKGLWRCILPPHTPASPRAYSVPVPQADTLKASPVWLCALGLGSEKAVDVTNVPDTFLLLCCLCHPGITALHHQPPPLLCFLQASICKIPKFSPCLS